MGQLSSNCFVHQLSSVFIKLITNSASLSLRQKAASSALRRMWSNLHYTDDGNIISLSSDSWRRSSNFRYTDDDGGKDLPSYMTGAQPRRTMVLQDLADPMSARADSCCQRVLSGSHRQQIKRLIFGHTVRVRWLKGPVTSYLELVIPIQALEVEMMRCGQNLAYPTKISWYHELDGLNHVIEQQVHTNLGSWMKLWTSSVSP